MSCLFVGCTVLDRQADRIVFIPVGGPGAIIGCEQCRCFDYGFVSYFIIDRCSFSTFNFYLLYISTFI